MRRSIIKGVRVIAFLLVVVLIWNDLTMKFRPNKLHPVFYEPENTLDVVMVGSSAWYTCWAPMIAYEAYGITSFDYAQGGMPADLMEYCIKEIEKSQNPQVIAIDARVFLYRDTNTVIQAESGKRCIDDVYIRTVADTMPNGWNRFCMLWSVRNLLEDGWTNQLDLLFYHDRWKELLLQGGTALQETSTRDYTKGFDWHGEITVYEAPDNVSGITETIPLPEETAQVLRKLCAYCESQEFQTVFVAIPTAEMTQEQQKQYNYMEQIIAEYDGVAYINMNDYAIEMGLDYTTDFYDATHGNYSGAVKFTNYFGAWLMQNYALPDRRIQEGYEFWQEDLAGWKQMLSYLQ